MQFYFSTPVTDSLSISTLELFIPEYRRIQFPQSFEISEEEIIGMLLLLINNNEVDRAIHLLFLQTAQGNIAYVFQGMTDLGLNSLLLSCRHNLQFLISQLGTSQYGAVYGSWSALMSSENICQEARALFCQQFSCPGFTLGSPFPSVPAFAPVPAPAPAFALAPIGVSAPAPQISTMSPGLDEGDQMYFQFNRQNDEANIALFAAMFFCIPVEGEKDLGPFPRYPASEVFTFFNRRYVQLQTDVNTGRASPKSDVIAYEKYRIFDYLIKLINFSSSPENPVLAKRFLFLAVASNEPILAKLTSQQVSYILQLTNFESVVSLLSREELTQLYTSWQTIVSFTRDQHLLFERTIHNISVSQPPALAPAPSAALLTTGSSQSSLFKPASDQATSAAVLRVEGSWTDEKSIAYLKDFIEKTWQRNGANGKVIFMTRGSIIGDPLTNNQPTLTLYLPDRQEIRMICQSSQLLLSLKKGKELISAATRRDLIRNAWAAIPEAVFFEFYIVRQSELLRRAASTPCEWNFNDFHFIQDAGGGFSIRSSDISLEIDCFGVIVQLLMKRQANLVAVDKGDVDSLVLLSNRLASLSPANDLKENEKKCTIS